MGIFDKEVEEYSFVQISIDVSIQSCRLEMEKLEKGHLLEIHLLEKSAQHQNLDCSTPFEQTTKIYETARKSKKYAVRVVSSRCKFEI